jgi:Ser/Thr protein kinase RdoA (MazF antagonist)
MRLLSDIRWRTGGWHGCVRPDLAVTPAEVLPMVAAAGGRRSRHARVQRVETRSGVVYVKVYPDPDGRRALRAYRMGRALARHGFGAPQALLVGRGGSAGVLVTQEVAGRTLLEAVEHAARARREKRALLRALGAEVGRLHGAGFVHGDLVPSNVLVADAGLVFLDHDRTRRSPLLVWWQGRRNLVQLGRFVARGVSLTDRARVLDAYVTARGFGARPRRRLARWLVRTTTRRRCDVDAIAPAEAARAGFRELMRSGGPFDPVRRRHVGAR